jgi:hypothetical protein
MKSVMFKIESTSSQPVRPVEKESKQVRFLAFRGSNYRRPYYNYGAALIGSGRSRHERDSLSDASE